MYGWRLRIGLIIPSSNTTMESELYRMCPEGISIHATRVKLREVTPEALIRMADEAIDAAKLLSMANVDLIIYGCTTGALVGGSSWERKLMADIEGSTGVKTITTAGAVVAALKSLNIKKVVVVTPYIEELNRLEQQFLSEHGIEVLKLKGLGIIQNTEIGKLSPWVSYRLAREIYTPEADGIFISCTNFRAIEVIEKLESELGKPVVTSNQASMWAALRIIKQPIKGYGMLLEERCK